MCGCEEWLGLRGMGLWVVGVRRVAGRVTGATTMIQAV